MGSRSMERASGKTMSAVGGSRCCVNSGRRGFSLLACGGTRDRDRVTNIKHVQAKKERLQSFSGRREGATSAGTTGSRSERSNIVARAEPNNGSPSQEAVLRSEAEAPFRVFRIACYAALAVSAGLGGLIATVRVIAGFAKGEILFSNILASEDCTGLAINLKKPRLVTLQQLQGFARIVVVAGDEEFLLEAVREAAEVKDMIKDRSICIIPLVLRGRQPDVSTLSELISA